jgi:hypothetical protein
MPAIIKTVLIIAPKILENVLEIKVLKNSLKSNALGYFQLYLRQGEKKVFNSNVTEKRFVANIK